MSQPPLTAETPIADFDAVVVGAGFSGLYLLHQLRDKLGLSVRVYDEADDVGGTWYWNRYPGLRCDAESIVYSYSFSEELQQEWTWTERYAAQPELLRYLQHVADRFDLRRDIQFETRVEAARYDERDRRWTVTTGTGERVRARFVVMATGNLSSFQMPSLEGLDAFAGEVYMTGRWPHEPVDFSGKRVGVLGTGSSGIQLIPKVAEQADQLYVFQRTPHFSLPAGNRPLDGDEVAATKRDYREIRDRARTSGSGTVPIALHADSALELTDEERRRVYDERWATGGTGPFMSSFGDLMTDPAANETAAEFVRTKIREIVEDPAVADKLCPRGYPLGSKRPVIDTSYYATYNQEHVTLVDVANDPIEELTEQGVRTGTGEYELDALVFATGFDAFTGALRRIDIRGREGASLTEAWADAPMTYLGLQVVGFPNLFVVTGPGSPSVLSNMVGSIEQHVEWISRLIAYMGEQGLETVEATAAARDAWVAHVNGVADATLYAGGNSWYTGANVPGKPRVFMPYVGGVGRYRAICDAVAANEYEGFAFGDGPGEPELRAAPRAPWTAEPESLELGSGAEPVR